jgi:hypothetical protein
VKSFFGARDSLNQAIAHRRLLETLPAREPLAVEPDPAPYLGSYTRPSSSRVVGASPHPDVPFLIARS